MISFTNRLNFAAIALCLGASAPAVAIDAEVLRLINEGNAFLDAGDTFNASISFVNAKGRAADVRDWGGMLDLSDRFFTIEDEWHGKDCFLIASQIAHEIADSAPTDGDPDARCAEAVNALDSTSLAWESGIIDIPMSEAAQSQMQAMADTAFDNARWYEENGCN